MKLKLEDAGFWKNCVSAIANIVDEGSFTARKEGLILRAIDPSGISMIVFNAPKDTFSYFEADENEEIGLDFEDLEKVTSRFRNGEPLEIYTEKNQLVMGFGKRGKVKLSLVEVSNKTDKDPDFGKDVEVAVNAYAFKETLKDASIISSEVTLEAANNSFGILAKSENGELEESIENDQIKQFTSKAKSAKATFSLDFLNDIVRACPDDAVIKINFGASDKPIRLEYSIGKASFIYFLAPIVEQS